MHESEATNQCLIPTFPKIKTRQIQTAFLFFPSASVYGYN